MAHAVISRLHANLAAVEAVLEDIDRQGIETITRLGDLVGYGPQPNEVVQLVRERAIPTCQGCRDEDIIDGLNACAAAATPRNWRERRGHRAHHWTAERMTDENKAFRGQPSDDAEARPAAVRSRQPEQSARISRCRT